MTHWSGRSGRWNTYASVCRCRNPYRYDGRTLAKYRWESTAMPRRNPVRSQLNAVRSLPGTGNVRRCYCTNRASSSASATSPTGHHPLNETALTTPSGVNSWITCMSLAAGTGTSDPGSSLADAGDDAARMVPAQVRMDPSGFQSAQTNRASPESKTIGDGSDAFLFVDRVRPPATRRGAQQLASSAERGRWPWR